MLRPDRTPHATDFIRQQIGMIEELIDKGLAYEANGSVYFDVAEYRRRKAPERGIPYGGLSNGRWKILEASGRIETNGRSERRRTSHSGNGPRSTTSCSGTHPGAGASPDGTWSAP